jgi:hypothetical protein
MTKTQLELIAQALANGGRGSVIQSWGRTPSGGRVRGSNARKLQALRYLEGGRFVTLARWPADPHQTHQSTMRGYTQYTVEHIYTVTDHGRACYEAFLRATA